MAKSQETFNKKEKEKNRLKKRQEKEEKKEARKASGGKNQSLEEMFAYVDENGNITSTPPDPNRRKATKAEDIEIGVPRQRDIPEADPIRKGIVTLFNESKGFGFIRDLQSQESLFVHVSRVKEPIRERDKVEFEVEMTPKGANAVNVRKSEG
ncbi:cold-shock protein [Larkinella soli]|uniref:cold-shock protein n=1 Tax=Larkinella soli TaxID=1770527 RepID=UPI000FFB3D00|nr:cold shock domain-containing protein [Larkinella soli]